MARVLTFSRYYPSYHPRAGEPTNFVEKIWESIYPEYLGSEEFDKLDRSLFDHIDLHGIFYPKHHTIRAGHRWKAGDWFKPVVWGDDINPKSRRKGPYHSKQIGIGPDIQVKKTWDFEVDSVGWISLAKPGEQLKYLDKDVDEIIAKNDGLDYYDFLEWIVMPFYRKGINSGPMQIICWNDQIEY